MALLFDWCALGGRGDDEYSPRTRAFTQARAYIEEHSSDRFVILELGDEATFRSTTFEPGPEALATLDRFEADTDATGFLIRGQHLDMRWLAPRGSRDRRAPRRDGAARYQGPVRHDDGCLPRQRRVPPTTCGS